MNPEVFTSNVLIEELTSCQFPVLTRDSAGGLAVVAIVRATETKIDFWIDVLHALPVTADNLFVGTSWIEDFKDRSKRKKKYSPALGGRGWTRRILRAAIDRYVLRYRNPPFCMVGVFDQENDRRFWEEFRKVCPNTRMADLEPDMRASIASACIKKTHFWPPRQELGYSLLMFEVDALAQETVLVRAFRDDLPTSQIFAIAASTKTHEYLSHFDNWKLVPRESEL